MSWRTSSFWVSMLAASMRQSCSDIEYSVPTPRLSDFQSFRGDIRILTTLRQRPPTSLRLHFWLGYAEVDPIYSPLPIACLNDIRLPRKESPRDDTEDDKGHPSTSARHDESRAASERAGRWVCRRACVTGLCPHPTQIPALVDTTDRSAKTIG